MYLPNYAAMMRGDRALNALFDNAKLKKAIPDLSFEFPLERGLDIILSHYSEGNYPIDYAFDGQIDYLLNKVQTYNRCKYVQYGQMTHKTLYLIYSKFSYKWARRVERILKKIRLC